MVVLSGMAPRNPITDVIPGSDDGDGLGLDQVSPVITEENYQQKQQPLKIVWQNVFIQLGIHLAALYGLIRIPWSHPLTWLWSKYSIFFHIKHQEKLQYADGNSESCSLYILLNFYSISRSWVYIRGHVTITLI